MINRKLDSPEIIRTDNADSEAADFKSKVGARVVGVPRNVVNSCLISDAELIAEVYAVIISKGIEFFFAAEVAPLNSKSVIAVLGGGGDNSLAVGLEHSPLVSGHIEYAVFLIIRQDIFIVGDILGSIFCTAYIEDSGAVIVDK